MQRASDDFSCRCVWIHSTYVLLGTQQTSVGVPALGVFVSFAVSFIHIMLVCRTTHQILLVFSVCFVRGFC